MGALLAPDPMFRAYDNNNNPLAGGQLYTYQAGTTTPAATYTDSTGNTPNSNPVVLNARGEAPVWLSPTQAYKLVLKDSSGNLIWTVDQITSPAPVAVGNMTDEKGSGGAVGFVSGVDFTAGTTTTLTLSQNYGSSANLWVAFDAAEQGGDTFSLSGTTLTFNNPIPVGVNKVYVKGGTSLTTGAPGNGTVGLSQLVFGNYLDRVVDSIAALQTLSVASTQRAYVTGYYAAGDGGGGHYYYSSSTPQSSANGGSIIAASGGVGCWVILGAPDWYVEQFGAVGNSPTHNDQPAIQAAINALPANGGTVRLRGKSYYLSAGITIGNGNGAGTVSTQNGVRLIGMGAGSGIGGTPTFLRALDGGQTAPYISAMITINGQIDSVYLEGFKIYCLGANSSPTTGSLVGTGILATSITGSTFKNIQIVDHTNEGLYILGGGSPTGNYNIYNQFHQIGAVSTINGHIGLLMDGNYSLSNDTWLCSFFNCRFDTNSATGAISGYFKFVDSCSFYRCHFVGNNTGGVGLSGCYGAYFNAVGNDQFPSGLCFHDCSVLSTFVNEDGSHHIRVNTFLNHGTDDNEAIPTHPNLRGITDTGIPFNTYVEPVSIASAGVGQRQWLNFNTSTPAVLPTGGTWEFSLIIINFTGSVFTGTGGIAAGGTTVDSSANYKFLDCKRIA